MTPQTMRVVIGMFCLTYWSCAWGATTMTVPIKEADFSAEDASPRWLDNTHVVFWGYPATEDPPHDRSHRDYVWDYNRGIVTKDPRFEHGSPRYINTQTRSYIIDRTLFLNGEQIEIPNGVWINPMSGRPAATQPPPWVVDGHTSPSKIPLLEEHGYLDRGKEGLDVFEDSPLLYYRPEAAKPISLGLMGRQIEPQVRYAPFAGAYLLSGFGGHLAVPPPSLAAFSRWHAQADFLA